MAHYHRVGESTARVTKTKEGRAKIHGVLATPRVSRNNVLYLPEQLAKNHGRTVIVDLEHDHNQNIGVATLKWNAELQRLEYSGEINNDSIISQLKDGQEYHTSLEGGCQSTEICGETACYDACVGSTTIERMALVIEPGIPETTVNISESCGCSKTSVKVETGNPPHNMAEQASTAAVKEQEPHSCPEGEEWDGEAGKCMPKKQETLNVTKELEAKLNSLGWYRPKKEKIEQAPVIDPDSTLGKKSNEVVVDAAFRAEEKRAHNPQIVGKAELEQVINPVIEQLKSMNRELADRGSSKLKDLAEKARPTATVGGAGTMTVLQEAFGKFRNFWENTDIISSVWKVNKEDWLRDHKYDPKTGEYISNQTTKEAITATNVPAVTFQRRIILDPTDITRYAARSACNVQEAMEGTDLVNWYTGNAGNSGFEDQSVGTTFTDRTVTITRAQAQLSKRVMGVKVGYYDVHDIPGGVLEFVNEVIGLRAIADENAFIVGTGSGGFAESGFTPTNWINGETGAVITASNQSGLAMQREGIVHAKRLISAQGFDVSPGAQTAILAPQPYAELLLDTDLNNYYQYAKPEITLTAVLEMLYGSEVHVSTAIPINDDTNDNYLNVMLTKGITSGLGVQSGQVLEFEADRRNDVAQVFVSGRHRAVGERILENSGCRINTTV